MHNFLYGTREIHFRIYAHNHCLDQSISPADLYQGGVKRGSMCHQSEVHLLKELYKCCIVFLNLYENTP